MAYDKAATMARHERYEAAGRCIHCGKPAAPERKYCRACLDYEGARAIAKVRARGVPPSRGRCSLCGVVGHYKPRCPERERLGAT